MIRVNEKDEKERERESTANNLIIQRTRKEASSPLRLRVSFCPFQPFLLSLPQKVRYVLVCVGGGD